MARQGRDPSAIVEAACRWVAEDLDRWDNLVRLCEWHTQAHPNRRLRRGDLWVYAQEAGLSVSLVEQFRFDNTLWAPLSRYIVMLRPHLAAAIRPKYASVDTVDFKAAWRLVVGDDSCFVCDGWREAAVSAGVLEGTCA